MKFLEDLCVKFLFWRGLFTLIDKGKGIYYDDGFDIQNNSDSEHYVLIIKRGFWD